MRIHQYLDVHAIISKCDDPTVVATNFIPPLLDLSPKPKDSGEKPDDKA